MLFLPELTLLAAGLIFFLLSLGQPGGISAKNTAIVLASVTLLASLLCIGQKGELFYAALRIDLFSQVFKALIAAATLLVLLFDSGKTGIKKDSRPEYYLFLFISALGLMMLVSSVELLAIFIALEISSFAVYIMVPMRDTSNGSFFQMEAGIKYLLFGVMATGFMLFGISYMYGLTGSSQLDVITEQLPQLTSQPAAIIAMLMILAGFFYKLALFPFHFWVPDVYEGAANETTSFIAAVPKLAAVALLIRLIAMVGGEGQVMLNLLMACSILSMFYGNLSALVQKDLKRMLGFSGIAHAGFVLLGLLTFQLTGYANAFYYIAGYVFMNLACFLVICSVSQDGKNLTIDDLSGLHKRAPLLALALTIGLFSLAGIPPFVGFAGKFMLLVGALKQDYLLLVVLAAINTGIAIYYYLSVVRVTFCSDPANLEPIKISSLTSVAALALILLIVGMGIYPPFFLNIATRTLQSIM